MKRAAYTFAILVVVWVLVVIALAFSARADSTGLTPFIRKDGTTATTANIPFAHGLSIPAFNLYAEPVFGTPGLKIGIPATVGGNGQLQAFVSDDLYFGAPREAYITTASTEVERIDLFIRSGRYLSLRAGINIDESGSELLAAAGDAAVGSNKNGGQVAFYGGSGGTLGGNGGDILFVGGNPNLSSGSGGKVRLYGGQGVGAGSRGYVGVYSSGTPNKFTLSNDATRTSLFIQNHLEVDGTTWLDGALNVAGATTLTSLGITADSAQIIFDSDSATTTTLQDSAASSSKTLTLPNSTATLAHIGNDAQTFAGTITFSNAVTVSSTSGINISNTTPTLTFTDASIGEDTFSLSTGSSGFLIRNTTDSRNVLAASNAGVNTFGDASSGSRTIFNAASSQQHIFQINSAEEVRIAADAMTFNNGAVDSVLGWATSGLLTLSGDFDVAGTTFTKIQRHSVTAKGNLGSTETFDCSTGSVFTGTLDADTAFTISNIATGQRVTIELYYTGAVRTISWAGVDKWAGSVIPTAGPDSGEVMIVTLFNTGTTITGIYNIFT